MACRAANNAHQRGYQRARAIHAWNGTSAWVPTLGIRRRLQALTAAGWSTSQLAGRLGVTKNAVAQLRSTGQDRVLTTTASDVTALYEACWWRTPTGRYQTRAERYAEGRGWIPPWRWEGLDIDNPSVQPLCDLAVGDLIDVVAVQATLAGRHVSLNRAERRAVVAALEERGASAAAIARIAGLSARSIQRYRAARRATPPAVAA